MSTYTFDFWSDDHNEYITVKATVTNYEHHSGEFSFNSLSDLDYYGYKDIDWEYNDIYYVDDTGEIIHLEQLSDQDEDIIREQLIELHEETLVDDYYNDGDAQYEDYKDSLED